MRSASSGIDINLESIFAGIAGAGDAGGDAADLAVGEMIILDRRQFGSGELLQSGQALWDLESPSCA